MAILVNGPSSSGKSTLCRALQERLSVLADGDATALFARVAFDDIVALIPDTLFPISFVALNGGDLGRLVSREPNRTTAAPPGNTPTRASPASRPPPMDRCRRSWT